MPNTLWNAFCPWLLLDTPLYKDYESAFVIMRSMQFCTDHITRRD